MLAKFNPMSEPSFHMSINLRRVNGISFFFRFFRFGSAVRLLQQAWLAGSHFHTQATSLMKEKGKTKKGASIEGEQGAQKRMKTEPVKQEPIIKKERKGVEGAVKAKGDQPGEQIMSDDQKPIEAVPEEKWVQMLCWVKCDSNGEPLAPFECRGIVNKRQTQLTSDFHMPPKGDAQEMPRLSKFNEPPRRQRTINDAFRQSQPSNSNSGRAFLDPDDVICAMNHKTNSHEGGPIGHNLPADVVCAFDNNLQKGAPSSSKYEEPLVVKEPDPMHMLSAMYHNLKSKQREEVDAKAWKDRIPKVSIKQAYIDEPAPKAKREQDCGKASWPKKFKKDKVELPALEQNMVRLATGKAQKYVILKGAGRTLGALEVSDDTPITDVKVLIGFYLSHTYDPFISLDVLHPKFFWTADMLEGFCAYINFWIWKLKNMQVLGEIGSADNYTSCLDLLLAALKSGHLKRCNEFKEKAFKARAKDDHYVLKNWPSIENEVKPAVNNALMILKAIGDKYIGQPSMPNNVLALANTCVGGVWEYNTFMGRVWEIVHCLAEDMGLVIEKLLEYLLCKEHKTSKTYGDLVKYLTPGLLEALIVYNKLPKPNSKYFLVPVSGGETISFQHYLKVFNTKFLKAKVSPTCNQNRKFWHNYLRQLTKNEQGVKEIMKILDAHGTGVQDKHYLISGPEDDLALAKELVKNVLGDPVPWPEKAATEKDLEDLLKAPEIKSEPESEENEFEEEAEELDYWEFGKLFGIRAPGQLDILPMGDVVGAEAMPILDKSKAPEQPLWAAGSGAAWPAACTEKDDEGKESAKGEDKKNEKDVEMEEAPKKTEKEIIADLKKKYPYLTSDSRRRTKIDPETHEKIWQYCEQWQKDERRGEFETPEKNVWYLELRAHLIDKKILTGFNCYDACRNSIRDTLTKLKAKKDEESKEAEKKDEKAKEGKQGKYDDDNDALSTLAAKKGGKVFDAD